MADTSNLKDFSMEEKLKYINNIVENLIIKKDNIDHIDEEIKDKTLSFLIPNIT